MGLDLFEGLYDEEESPIEEPGLVVVDAKQRVRGKTGIKEPEAEPLSRRYARDKLPTLFSVEEIAGDEYKPFDSTRVDMKDVEEVAGTNGLTVISGFTGAGGSVTGFSLAGWKEIAASEFVNNARETLSSNYNYLTIHPQDVLEIAEDVYEENADYYSQYFELIENKESLVRGEVIPPSLSWERIQDNLSMDEEARNAYSEFRYAVNKEVFDALWTGVAKPGQMLLWGDDVRGLDPIALMEALDLKPGELDCWEASPPCKSFSAAGIREGKWGLILKYSDEREQKSDDLFFEYLRLVDGLKPRSFLAENVEGLALGQSEADVLQPFSKAMSDLGYIVDYRVLMAADFGVPQERVRLFIQGIKEGELDKDGNQIVPTWPEGMSYRYSVDEALENLEIPDEELVEFWIGSKKELFDAYPHIDPSLVEEIWKAKADIPEDEDRFSIGTVWKRIGPGGSPKDSYYQLTLAHPKRPAPTITATAAGIIPAAGVSHYKEPRKFTLTELKALFTFPRDYQLLGDREQQGERIGRSVPPFMMRAIAKELGRNLRS